MFFTKLTNLRPSVHVFAPQLVNVSPSHLLLLLPELLCLLSLAIKKVVKICCLFLLAEPADQKSCQNMVFVSVCCKNFDKSNLDKIQQKGGLID